MKIALLAPFEEGVPPEKYGGTELIVYSLAQLLPQKGHKVYLLASGDSRTKAELLPIFPAGLRKEKLALDLKSREAFKYIGISKIIKALLKIKVDIIHNHIGWRFLPFAFLFDAPTLTTLHGPLDSEYQRLVYGQFKQFPYVSVSKSQQKPFPGLNYAATIYNGINVKDFEFNDKPKNYFAFLGRMSPEKGPAEAIKAAKKAKAKLKMAAKIDVVDKEFFEKAVKPFINQTQIEFRGEIGPKEKNEFLKNALALLAPLQWKEPFGLFMVEAMACGTPVIVFDQGSAKEIVEDGKTGFVVKNLDEMVRAIKKITNIKRDACRKRVEELFTDCRMVSQYEKIYKEIIKK